ncbi:MAG TPA: hypothetical protein VN665_04165, partial [Candidatus Paceibacterota bacterium]|nr:hypothetical protein [Candidatus Paceibacterota bacterium]
MGSRASGFLLWGAFTPDVHGATLGTFCIALAGHYAFAPLLFALATFAGCLHPQCSLGVLCRFSALR